MRQCPGAEQGLAPVRSRIVGARSMFATGLPTFLTREAPPRYRFGALITSGIRSASS